MASDLVVCHRELPYFLTGAIGGRSPRAPPDPRFCDSTMQKVLEIHPPSLPVQQQAHLATVVQKNDTTRACACQLTQLITVGTCASEATMFNRNTVQATQVILVVTHFKSKKYR